MSEIIKETINELNKPTQNNVFSIEDNPVTVLEKINQVERYLKQIDTRVDTSINTANEALEKANNAFEANGTLVKINGENQLTWSADFAESERQKSQTDGAIVHEKEIANVEHIETIYEMNTKNTIGGVPYTSGIPFSDISISNVDFTSYKYLRFTCRWNTHLSNWFGGAITFDLDLTTPYNSDSNYISVISNRPSNCYVSDDALTFDLVGYVEVVMNKNGFNVKGYKITYTGERTAYTSDNYLPYFRIEKIEGIK